MNKERKRAILVIKIVISVLAVAVVVFCLTKCVVVTNHPSFNAWDIDTWDQKITREKTTYSPLMVIICSVTELILLWVVKERFIYAVGFLLNGIGAFGPYVIMRFFQYTLEKMNNSMYDYASAYAEYKFLYPVYIIIAIGAVISVLYIVLFILHKKTPKNKPQQA